MDSKDNNNSHHRYIKAGFSFDHSNSSRSESNDDDNDNDDDSCNNCKLIKSEVALKTNTSGGDKEFIAMDVIAKKNISGAVGCSGDRDVAVADNRTNNNVVITELESDITNVADTTSNKVKKSSDRNAINFMVLGYVILVIILTYCYFGTRISDYFLSANSDPKDFKFLKTITSTELIVILWFTIIYGTCLLLFLRFKVLRLERDPNSDKHKKKRKSEDFTAFLNSNRDRDKKSFKKCDLTHVIADASNNGNNSDSNKNKNMPFWKK